MEQSPFVEMPDRMGYRLDEPGRHARRAEVPPGVA